uniref:Uncharacterized protein n=1 Tax=Lactuca sativa TaxID=4236 RepID=A0A9R1WCV0_LACSA|nr:hypothetical protein LSAT_V11C200066880 [Lactuca sativa]
MSSSSSTSRNQLQVTHVQSREGEELRLGNFASRDLRASGLASGIGMISGLHGAIFCTHVVSFKCSRREHSRSQRSSFVHLLWRLQKASEVSSRREHCIHVVNPDSFGVSRPELQKFITFA